MKKGILLALHLLAACIAQRSYAQVTQSFIGAPSTHETVMDIAYLANGNTVSVGQRSVNINGTGSDALIFVKDANNMIVWSQVYATPAEEVFSKVMVAQNGDIIAVGRTGDSSKSIVCRYQPNGTLVWSRGYRATPATRHGEAYFGICQNTNTLTGDLYLCGGTDYAPEFADAMVTCINFNTGAHKWSRHYNIAGDTNLSIENSDAFASIAFYNNHLYTLGYFQRDYSGDYYDLNVFCLDTTGVQRWRNRVNLSVKDKSNVFITNAYPQEIQVSNTGRFLISVVVTNNFPTSQSSVSTVLGGRLNADTMTISNSRTYRSSEFAYDNTCRLVPTDTGYTSFLLAQMPGITAFNSNTNFPLNNISDARVSQINNFDQIAWTREFVHAGQQGIYAMALMPGHLALAGSSFGAPFQADSSRDAFIIETPLSIALTDTFECGIRDRRDTIQSYTFNPVSESWLSKPMSITIDTPQMAPQDLTVKGSCGCIDQFTTALANDTIKTSTMLHGRYYVTGTLTVAAGVTLDITNVDMLFASCAGINVQSGAHIRANNSVFRTCDETAIWRGITFNGSQNNLFDECTFKNAERALNVMSGSTARINNNYFQNCVYGVIFNRTQSDFPVTGNNFVHDNLYTSLRFSCSLDANTQSMAIMEMNSMIRSDISHNNFINSSKAPYIGVMVTSNSYLAALSQNNFTNMQNSCYYTNLSSPQQSDAMKIEDNHIENTIFNNFGSQIFVTKCNNRLTVANNSIHTDIDRFEKSVYAVELIESNNIYVQDNTITGYSAAIVSNSTTRTNLNDNKIYNPLEMGIMITDSRAIDTRCNQIDMNHRSGAVGIYADGKTESVNIYTNCISNCTRSIDLEENAANINIYNNFMYNYSEAGVYNASPTPLNIGQSGQDGQNTFWSNDNNAFDIYTDPVGITYVVNNFGVFNFNYPYTNLLANNPSNSTASCGHQIFDMPSQGNYNPMYDCDHIADFKEGTDKALAEAKEAAYNTDVVRYYLSYFYQQSPAQADKFYQGIQSDHTATAYDKAITKAAYAYLKGNNDDAMQALDGIQPADQWQGKEVFLYRILLKANFQQADMTSLSQDDLNVLRSYQNSESHRLDDIYALMNLNNMYHDFQYTPMPVKTVSDLSSAVKVSTLENSMTVYPNPVHSILNLRINSTGNTTGKVLIIYSMQGDAVMRKNIEVVAGGTTVDVSSLADGNYLAVVVGGKSTMQAKFNKH